jgi:hypothetical protein
MRAVLMATPFTSVSRAVKVLTAMNAMQDGNEKATCLHTLQTELFLRNIGTARRRKVDRLKAPTRFRWPLFTPYQNADQSIACMLLTRASQSRYSQPSIATDTAATYANLPDIALHEEPS